MSRKIFTLFVVVSLTGFALRPAFAGQENLSVISLNIDSYSGSSAFSLPIHVPSGRGGIQPNLQLQYSSSLANDLLGVGWTLEIGSIERSTRHGTPKYDSTDTFLLKQSGATQELVPIGGNLYALKFEGAFMKIEFVDGDYWRVKDKNGITYIFGNVPAYQERDPQDTTHVFKWCLSYVYDVHGNDMTVEYTREGEKLLPQAVRYYRAADTPLASIEFDYQTRDDVQENYYSGYVRTLSKRLNGVRVYAYIGVTPQLQRKYVLAYDYSGRTKRSLLTSVTQYGSNGTSNLPAITLNYQEDSLTYASPVLESQFFPAAEDNFAGDFNGDGFIDAARFDKDAGSVQVRLSQGRSFLSASTWTTTLGANKELFSGDFDGDGRTDVGAFDEPNGNWLVALSDGSQFVNDGNWITGFGQNEPKYATGDFDADGLTDIVSISDDGGVSVATVVLNTGASFDPSTAQVINVSNSNADVFSGDFNGDGYADLAMVIPTTGHWEFILNPGNYTGEWIPMPVISGFGQYIFVVSDINGDRMTDIGYLDYQNGKIHYRRSKGTSFDTSEEHPVQFTTQSSIPQIFIRPADYDGNGLLDFMLADTTENYETVYANGIYPDLLASTNNGVGGVTSINYTPSTIFDHEFLPFPVQVVESVTVLDSRGDSFTTTYEYADGFWDKDERVFSGFGLVKTIDAEGHYSETDYLTHEIKFKGRIAENRSYNNQAQLVSKTVNEWQADEIVPGSVFVFLKRKDNFVYDGDARGRRTAEEFFYEEIPQYGNLTKAVQLGEVDLNTGLDIGSDRRTVETSHVNGTNLWLLGLPSQTVVKDNAGAVVRKSWFAYDNNTNYTNPILTKGLLTKKEDWAGDQVGAVNPVTQYSYDNYGNLAATTDPLNKTTTISYDTTYHIFPVTTTNALNHSVVNEYYGVNETPESGFSGLWGQLKSTTDPNNQVGKRSYDVFGRLTATVSPLDSISYPTQTTEYAFYSNYTKVTSHSRIKHGEAATIDTVSFYDGLGRHIQTKAKSGQAGQYVVSGQARYNSRGLVSEQYLPYFTANALDVMETIDTTKPHTLITYDAAGRVAQTTNPDGTYSSVQYDDWTTSAMNENGHRQKSYFDAYGRLIKKEEYLGADGRSPHYPAKPYTLYASTLYLYDSEGNLIQTIDAYNNTTTITYDKLGRKISMDDPDMGVWQYAYDLNGNLIRQTDAKGRTIYFTYDALNRLTNKTDQANLDVDYTYDDAMVTNSKGRLTKAAYGLGIPDTTNFYYDDLGRETTSIKTIGAGNYQVQRSYNALNNLMDVQYPDASNIFYKYNAAGQIEAISNDPALLGPQSFNWHNDRTSYLVHRTSKANEIRTTNDESRSTKYERRTTQTVLSSIANWFERYVLGVGEAEAQTTLPSPWVSRDIGGPGVAGSASYTSGVFTVKGSGSDIWGSGDKFHFVYQPLSGDGEIIARVESIQNTNAWAKAGVMLRENLTAGSRHAMMVITPGKGSAFQRRLSPNSTSYSSHGDTVKAPYWVKVKRRGNSFSGYKSADGVTWVQMGPSVTISMAANIYVGLALTSHNNTVLNTSLFSNVQVRGKPAAPVLNTATPGDKQVSLSWSAVSSAAGYKVKYGTASGTYGTTIDVGNVTTKQVTGLTNGTTYYFVAVAYNVSGGSPNSNEKSAVPQAPPAAPVLNAAVAGDAQVTLDWSAAAGATGYKVYYGTAAGQYGTPISVGNTTTSTVTGLTNGTTYYFAVSGYNSSGESLRSNELNAQPLDSSTLYVKNVDYNAAGQITKIEYGNGNVTEYTYNPLNLRLTRLKTYDLQLTTIQDLSYTYDSVGNILSITDAVNTASQTFKYDELNRLTEATGGYGLPAGQAGTKSYAYDALGNIVEKDGKTYFYGGMSGGPHAVTSLSDGTTFAYDANGNMVTKAESGITTAYTYDAENRLIKVVKNGGTIAQYEYDGDGGRTKKTATVGTTTTTTTFVGSLFETSGVRSTKFIFLGGQRVAAVTNSPSLGSTTLYYHADHLGGTNVLTDATGFKKELIEYEPFGLESRHEKYGSSEEIAWYYFTGKPKDDETGLYYFGARYYDPSLGRFITPDPTIQHPYDPQDLNRYTYSRNNPVNLTDPSGYGWFKKFIGKIVGAVAAIGSMFMGADPGTAFAIFNIVDTAISGGIALANGANPGLVLGSIGLSIGLNMLVPGGDFNSSNLFAQIGFHAARGATISVATTAAITGGQGDLGEAAAWGGGMGGLGGFMASEQVNNAYLGNGFRSNNDVRSEARRVEKLKAMLETDSVPTPEQSIDQHSLVEVFTRGLEDSNGQPQGIRVHPAMKETFTDTYHELVVSSGRIKILDGGLGGMSPGTRNYVGSYATPDSTTMVYGSAYRYAMRGYKATHEGQQYMFATWERDCRGFPGRVIRASRIW